MNPLKVAINAHVPPTGHSGGVTTVLEGLVRALGQLQDGDERYVLIASHGSRQWLQDMAAPNQTVVVMPKKGPQVADRSLHTLVVNGVRRRLRNFLGVTRLERRPTLPVSNGFYESLGCAVIHFPYQFHRVCALPTIYNPHDLQHLHYPEYFSPETIAERELLYPAGCHHAHTVVVASEWIKQDIVRHYGTHPDKIQVIPWAPPTAAYDPPSPASTQALLERLGVQGRYLLYPAVTWPHKNHLRLLQALARLRDQHRLEVTLVCTGRSEGVHFDAVQAEIARLDLGARVLFPGYLEGHELRSLYQGATAVVVPTLFEAASGPVFEAWQEGKAVACSTVTSLPEQVGDAALLFDPLSVDAIAAALRQLLEDDALRESLEQRGRRRLSDFSWERTARAYRAVYRRAARLPLDEDDRALLRWDWMKTER